MAKLLWSLALLASTVSGRPSGLRALFARDAPSVAVSEYFVEPAPDFAHDARTFRVDALPETDELVAPFVGATFRYPFVKVQLDGGETTKNASASTPLAGKCVLPSPARASVGSRAKAARPHPSPESLPKVN